MSTTRGGQWFLASLLLATATLAAERPQSLLPGETFVVEGHTAFVILPAKPAAQATPWVWYAPTLAGSRLPGGAEEWMFQRFTAAGIAIAGIDVGESYGSPDGRALYAALYRELTERRGFAKKAVLLGRSRGGLMLYSWAAENADKVAGIAGIYPVCNIASYPGIDNAAGAFKLTPAELTAKLAEHNPPDRLGALAKAGVPLFAIHGDVDQLVPLEKNSGEIARRYRQLGGQMQLLIPKGQGHNMWEGFFHCQELVDFVLKHAPAARWPKLEEVIVVSKTHFDIGYTDLASRVVDRYRTSMADQALQLVDESRGLPPDQQFTWTLAGWPMAQILWPGQTPERRERFLAAMRAGRMAPQALAFTTHTESLDLEDLARGFRYSVEMARLAGRPLPTSAKMTDVTSHTAVTATLLAQAGVKFFHLGCNEGCSHPDVPLLHWWEGPDGSRVLTMFSAAYGSSLTPPPNWPHKVWLCMWMTGDNHGPPNTKEVQELFARAQRELPGVRVRFGQMSDFAEALVREQPDLPVIRGDMPDTWIHGIGSMPIETQAAHATRPRIAALETLDTLLGAWGVPTPPAGPVVAAAYENTLLFGEHTWGPDVGRYAGYSYGEPWKKKLAAGGFKFLLEGFAQKRAYAHQAAATVDAALQQRLDGLARAVNVAGRRVVVFNPLPWPRDGEVDVPWSGTVTGVTEVATQQASAAAADAGRLRFVARNLPPLGYRTYVPAQQPPAEHSAPRAFADGFENERFRVTLDPARCGIRSIVDKRTGRELVNVQSPYALGQYLYERFDAAQNAAFTRAYVLSPNSGEMISHGKPGLPSAQEQPYRAATAGAATVEIRSDAVQATAVLKAAPRGIIPDATQLRVTLYAGQPWLDLEWSITHKTPDPWPEGGWLCFPLRAENPTFHLARLGCIVNPAQDLVPGSNHELFCLNGGLLVSGSESGRTGLCPIDAQLVSLERPGLWRYSRDFVAHKPDVFVNLFNNVYSTNFAQWIEGSWSSRVRLWLVEPDDSTASSLVGGSWEARAGCLAAVADGGPGGLPPSSAGLALTKQAGATAPSPPAPAGAARRGLLVTAFGANPYGAGTLLRLWEQTGDSGVYTVRLPQGLKARTAQPCDLRGQPCGAPLTVSEQGLFEVNIRPLAPLSLILL